MPAAERYRLDVTTYGNDPRTEREGTYRHLDDAVRRAKEIVLEDAPDRVTIRDSHRDADEVLWEWEQDEGVTTIHVPEDDVRRSVREKLAEQMSAEGLSPEADLIRALIDAGAEALAGLHHAATRESEPWAGEPLERERMLPQALASNIGPVFDADSLLTWVRDRHAELCDDGEVEAAAALSTLDEDLDLALDRLSQRTLRDVLRREDLVTAADIEGLQDLAAVAARERIANDAIFDHARWLAAMLAATLRGYLLNQAATAKLVEKIRTRKGHYILTSTGDKPTEEEIARMAERLHDGTLHAELAAEDPSLGPVPGAHLVPNAEQTLRRWAEACGDDLAPLLARHDDEHDERTGD